MADELYTFVLRPIQIDAFWKMSNGKQKQPPFLERRTESRKEPPFGLLAAADREEAPRLAASCAFVANSCNCSMVTLAITVIKLKYY